MIHQRLHGTAKFESIMYIIDRQCEKFMGGPTVPYQARVHVTLDKKGKIFLNQKAHKMMGRPLAVYLYYNRTKDMIILERTDALASSNSFLFREGGNAARIIWAGPFCRHFNIRVEGTVKFVDPTTDTMGNLYLKLSEPSASPAGRGGRKRIEIRVIISLISPVRSFFGLPCQ